MVGQPGGVAKLAYLDDVRDARVPELGENALHVKLHGRLGSVRLDTPHKVWAG